MPSKAEPANVQESTTNPVATGIDLRSNTGLLTAIRTNFVPSSHSELNLLSQCISDAECDVQRRDEEIQKLTGRAKLDSLQNERNEAYRRICRYRSLLAPIRRLCPELLSLIFQFACPKTTIKAKINCPLFRVSQVCARWRELARSTPTLWSSFDIDVDASWHHDTKVIKSVITTHLELSRNSPLSLSLTASGQSSRLQCIVDAIAPHSFH
ncbi:hypothetical protein K435DRAFT_747644, partial [Dendrothele bispora CBS 962.96]